MKNAIKKIVENFDFESEADFYKSLEEDRKGVIDHLKWRSCGGRMKGESISADYAEACKLLLLNLK